MKYIPDTKNLSARDGLEENMRPRASECVGDFGRVFVYGTATGKPAQVNAGTLYAKGASVHGLWLTYLSMKSELMNSAWKQLLDWTGQGHLRPIVGHILPMEKAADAYRLLLGRKNFGKVVLRIAI